MFNNRALNWFTSGMVDIQLQRYPLSQKVVLIFNDTVRDHYQDPVSLEEVRVEKWAIVRKSPDMNFIQQYGDALLEDYQREPWVVGLTTTGLPRMPKLDDAILIEGERFIVSLVKPINRYVNKVLWIFVYPERNDEEDYPQDVKDPIYNCDDPEIPSFMEEFKP